MSIKCSSFIPLKYHLFHLGNNFKNYNAVQVSLNSHPFLLPCYCGLSSLQNVASVAETSGSMIGQGQYYRVDGPKVPVKWLQRLLCKTCAVWGFVTLLKGHAPQQISRWIPVWSTEASNWEVPVSTIMRKCQWLFVNSCEYKSLIYTMTP